MSLNQDYNPLGGVAEHVLATTATAGRKRRVGRRPVYSHAGNVAIALALAALVFFAGRMT